MARTTGTFEEPSDGFSQFGDWATPVSDRQIDTSSHPVVGQADAILRVRAVVHRYRSLPGEVASGSSALLVGPMGCGKSITMEIEAERQGLPLVRIDLHEPAARGGGLLPLASERLRQAGVLESGKAVILIEGVERADQPLMDEIALVFNGKAQVRVAFDGKPLDQDLSQFLWVAELSRPLEKADDYVTRIVPRFPGCHLVPFRSLTKPDFYEILSQSPRSPLEGLRSSLLAAGVEVEFSELAIWQIVNDAWTRYQESGAWGLVREVADLELRIWAQAEGSDE